ncbi:hypothetical protein [Paracoccus liaowanqingii]|nr:hypothetical protein [Paracoccus liaowanqingii]
MTLTIPDKPIWQQVAQVIQAMAARAGVTIRTLALDVATLLSSQTAGDHQADLSGCRDPRPWVAVQTLWPAQ